jgi:sec-independent protein translocase protein TatB
VFDLSFGKLLVIGVIALFLVGPEKLPQYAAQLGRWVRVARSMLDEAKGRVTSELGPEFDDVDWASLDPRRYSPKRLLADAWNATDDAPRPARPAGDAVVADAAEPDLLALADARARADEPKQAPAAHFEVGS